MKHRILGIIVMILASVFVITLADSHKGESAIQEQTEAQSDENVVDDTIVIWYAYKGYEKYLQYAIMDYTQNYDKEIKIEIKYIHEPKYFDYINTKSLDGEGPDLFIMGSEYVEKAYLLGLLEDNYNTELYNEENYPKIALDAATYSDRLLGYPLGFDVCALASNDKFINTQMKTFEDIKNFADTFGKTDESEESEETEESTGTTDIDISNISQIITWDVNKLLMNYGFVGKYIKFSNDSEKSVNMNNSNVLNAAKKYVLLKEYFSLTGEDTYEMVKEKFHNEEIVFALVGTDIVKTYDSEKFNYTVSPMPNLTDSIDCMSLSYTDILGVNPRSNKKERAVKFAEFLSYTFAENMHAYSSIISCRKSLEYANKHINQFINVYEQSIGMPNMMETEDYNIIMEEAIKAVWNGADIADMFDSLQKRYSERFK